jgi:FkbM family methyltransferase
VRVVLNLLRFLTTRQFLRRSLRYRVFDFFKLNHYFECKFYGLIWSGNLNNYIDRSVFFFGAHEREYLEFSANFLSSESFVIDAGANVGNHSLFYSTLAKEVHAFEPNPQTFTLLKDHSLDNGIKNLVLNNSALVATNGSYSYFSPTGDNLGVGSLLSDFASSNSKLPLKISHIIGDQYVDENLTDLSFIKVDTEGYDSHVLFGLSNSIFKFRPIIQLEYSRDFFVDWDLFRSSHLKEYKIFSMICNRPIFMFNRAKVQLCSFDKNKLRSEILMIPEDKFYNLELDRFIAY